MSIYALDTSPQTLTTALGLGSVGRHLADLRPWSPDLDRTSVITKSSRQVREGPGDQRDATSEEREGLIVGIERRRCAGPVR